MSHKTLISGTAYEVVGGAQMIDGTKFQMGGRTLVDGTEYEIGFSRLYTVTITANSPNMASATINGTKYTAAANLEVEGGTEIELTATRNRGVEPTIKLNGAVVVTGDYILNYTYVVETDTEIYLNENEAQRTSEISITTK